MGIMLQHGYHQLDYHLHVYLQEILILELLDHFLLHLLSTVVGIIPDGLVDCLPDHLHFRYAILILISINHLERGVSVVNSYRVFLLFTTALEK